MANEKIERVNADNITLFYDNSWYCILFTNLVNVQAARDRYGLFPSTDLFIPLGMLTPFAPEIPGKPGCFSDEVVYPQPPAMTEDIEQEMRVRLMKQRIQATPQTIFLDLKLQFDVHPTDYADLLTESLLP